MKGTPGLASRGPLSCCLSLTPVHRATPASASAPLPSRLSCVLTLGFGVSTSASPCPCFCHCLFLFSLLLPAPVDIKVIKDLPWPPPVGQLDSSPSLPDGDRDVSGPASPLPEPSLEDSSGGSCGGSWPGPHVRGPLGLCGLKSGRGLRGGPRKNASWVSIGSDTVQAIGESPRGGPLLVCYPPGHFGYKCLGKRVGVQGWHWHRKCLTLGGEDLILATGDQKTVGLENATRRKHEKWGERRC